MPGNAGSRSYAYVTFFVTFNRFLLASEHAVLTCAVAWRTIQVADRYVTLNAKHHTERPAGQAC